MAHEFDGEKYRKASAHQKEWGTSLIAGLDLRGDESVLDLGCGDGVLTARIADLVPDGEVVGIDASQGMIDVARGKSRENLSFLRMDIDELDMSERFDVVFSNAALHWVKDHDRLLGNVRRALRNEGRISFNFAGDGNCSNFFQVVREAMEREEFGEHFAGFQWPWYMPDADGYRAQAERSALRQVRVWGENADRFFPDEEALTGWIDQPSLVPFLAQVPQSKRESFRDFVVGAMIARTRQDDGRCFETFRRINVTARK